MIITAVTSEGAGVEVLRAASTQERFKKTKPVLQNIVESSRVYGEGVDFVVEIAENNKKFGLNLDL